MPTLFIGFVPPRGLSPSPLLTRAGLGPDVVVVSLSKSLLVEQPGQGQAHETFW